LPDEEADEAIAEMVRAWAPKRDPWIYSVAAHYYARRGEGADPAALWAKGAKADPLNSTGSVGYIWAFLAGHLCDSGELEKGLEFCLKAAELEPEWAEPWQTAGEVADAAGQPERAAEYHQRAVEVGSR